MKGKTASRSFLLAWIVILILSACTPRIIPLPPPTLKPLPVTPSAAAGEATASPWPSPVPTSSGALPPAAVFPDPRLYTWEMVVSGLVRPVDIQSPPAQDRLFIVEQDGRIRLFQNGQLLQLPFLDISDRVGTKGAEQGLLGLAFHPEFEKNGYFYVNYTDLQGNTVIARFQAEPGAVQASPATEKRLLYLPQPYPNHNGGGMAFGPDGYLYLALGDGGSAGDPQNNAQNPRSLLGKLLRIDVDRGEPYAIPPDNPFGNEVWAYGLRNPWRFAFDRNGDLYIADVGQNKWEEVNFLPAGSPSGANFGWNFWEGNHPYRSNPPATGFLFPVAEYGHDQGCSVTGGVVYRGAMPEWQGIYFFGDYCSGRIWGLLRTAQGWQMQPLFETHANISTFGRDAQGEVYFAHHGGSLYRLQRRQP
ncbi:MAG: PQQ-dependent sugar dehydrogenase [Chloroflexi bacterium]|nr:PQQ-dependent sugar dehydrogenase [Chloroflexota bacterium]